MGTTELIYDLITTNLFAKEKEKQIVAGSLLNELYLELRNYGDTHNSDGLVLEYAEYVDSFGRQH